MSFYEEVKELAGLKEDDEVTGILIVLLFALLLVPAVLGVFNFLGGEADGLIEEATGVVEELEVEDGDTFELIVDEEADVFDEEVIEVEVEEEVAPTAVPTRRPQPTAVPTSASAIQQEVIRAPLVELSTIDYVSRTETDITLSGVASAGENITVLDNGVAAGSVVADEAGNWMITIPFNQSIKEHIYEAKGLAEEGMNSVKYIIAD